MIEALAQNLGLGSLLDALRGDFGGYDILEHWQRGEFHHDLVVRVEAAGRLPGPVLVVATNCNGGVKEILCFSKPPDHDALWHHRCPENLEFRGELPAVLAAVRTVHWFDPCELLGPDARSEYRPEHRERQPGGGWQPRGCGVKGEAGSDATTEEASAVYRRIADRAAGGTASGARSGGTHSVRARSDIR